jgi:hypothetical protein
MAEIQQTNVSTATPEFWFAIAIGALRGVTVMPKLIRTDMRNEVAARGKTVNITKRGALTVQTKTGGNPVVPEGPSNTKVPVTLEHHKYVSWTLEDAAGSVAIDDAVNYIQDGMTAIAEEIEGDILTLHSEIATSVGTAGTDLSKASILAARKTLNDQKCPQTGRVIICSTKDDVALLNLEQFTRADARGARGQTALDEAHLGRVFGFDTYMSQFIDVTPGAPDSTHNIAFHKNAFALVSRPLALPPEQSGATSMIFLDKKTGIAVRITKQWNITALATTWVIDLLYGYAALDEDRCAVHLLA